MHVSLLVWAITLVALIALLAVDLAIIGRRPHEPSMKEASIWVGVYVALAVAFGLILLVSYGPRYGGEFFAGWLTEYSLSIDNLFVFVIIMAGFAVPRVYQQKVLLVGIILALVMRGRVHLRRRGADQPFRLGLLHLRRVPDRDGRPVGPPQRRRERRVQGEPARPMESADPADFRRVRRCEADHASTADQPRTCEGRFADTAADKRGHFLFTPMLIVMIAIGTTDLVFALDSIPAIFGLTKEAYIVFTANVFALMGLRQLYFLLGGLLDRLVYLSYGLAAVLGFIGVKLVLEALHGNNLPFLNGGEPIGWAPHIPIWMSLTVIVVALATATIASLVKSSRDAKRPPTARTGSAETDESMRVKDSARA